MYAVVRSASEARLPSRHVAPPSALLPHLAGSSYLPQLRREQEQRRAHNGSLLATNSPKKVLQRIDALADVECFLRQELARLAFQETAQVPSELRLQKHKEALELLISRLGTQAAPLSAIKREYDAEANRLETEIRQLRNGHAAAMGKFEQSHSEITTALRAELQAVKSELAHAKVVIEALQEGNVKEVDKQTLAGTKVSTRPLAGNVKLNVLDNDVDPIASPSSFSTTSSGTTAGIRWTFVARVMDTSMAKVDRLLKAVERQCTTPELLIEAVCQLMAMLSLDQLEHLIVGFYEAGVKEEQRVSLACALNKSMSELDRSVLIEHALLSLSPSAMAALLEETIIKMSESQRERLLTQFIDALSSEEARLAAARTLLSRRPVAPSNRDDFEGKSHLHAQSLASADSLLALLVDLWGGEASERAAALLLKALPQEDLQKTLGQVLASSAADPLRLEQALDLIYDKEDVHANTSPSLSIELSTRRREQMMARRHLAEGRSPKVTASTANLSQASVAEDGLEGAGGLRLTCHCTRRWVLPSCLLHTVQGETSRTAPPLSIRRFVDERFQFIHAAIEISAAEEGREDSRMSSSALLVVFADLWTELAAPRLVEGHTGSSPLNVSALLWERMLQHNALKSVAQAKLAALTSSLETEASLSGCTGRLRLAAEMIGLGSDQTPWSEGKTAFFLWILRMCLPLNQLKQRLNEPGVMLELSTAKDLLMKAVSSQRVRDQLLADLQWYFHAPQACMSPATRSTEAANMAPPAKSPPKATEIGWVPLDAVLCTLMDAWSANLDAAVRGDEKQLLLLASSFDMDGDGALDFNEFKLTVQATACIPSEELLPLYEEALAKTKEHRERAVEMEAAPRICSTILSANSRQALDLPVAVDPAAFAEVVARKTCLSPPDFKLPSNSSFSEHDSLIDDLQ